MQYLVCSVEAVSRAVRLGHVQNTHLTPAGLQQRRPPVVMIGQNLQEVFCSLQQAVVHMQRVPGPQLQVQLQHDGLGVLGVQRPGTPQLHRGAPVGPEKVWRSKGAVEVPQVFPTGGVGAAQLVGAVGTVPGSVTAQGGGQAAGGLGLGAGQGAKGAESRPGLGGRGGAAALVCGVSTLILTVTPPGARETLPVPTQELI